MASRARVCTPSLGDGSSEILQVSGGNHSLEGVGMGRTPWTGQLWRQGSKIHKPHRKL